MLLWIDHAVAAFPATAEECIADVCACPPDSTLLQCTYEYSNTSIPPYCYGEAQCQHDDSDDELDEPTIVGI